MQAMEVGERLGRLRAALSESGGAASLLVASLYNIRYLTGFTGSAGMLFVFPEEAVLLTDGRYGIQAEEQLSAAGVQARIAIVATAGHAAAAGELVGTSGITSLTIEAAHVSWARARAFADQWFAGVDLVPSVGVVERLRRIKDPGEIGRLAEAAHIADQALSSVRDQLAKGPSEVDFGRALDFEMSRLGATGPSFQTIVASGANSAKPHHRPGERVVGAGEPVVLDFGALFDGYCSDMTRTVWVGDLDHPDLRRAVSVVTEAQSAGVAAVRAGVACVEVDRACRSVISAAGWGDYFVHGTGHGVGLEIHEAPALSATSTDTLEAGHVVTVEPGVYLPGVGGVRIEDTVVVTGTGCRPLTSTPKDTV